MEMYGEVKTGAVRIRIEVKTLTVQHLHVASTAVVTVHIGKSTKEINVVIFF
jgi:hypothetical protein